MKKYQLVVFDFDGTLCSTLEAILYSVRKAYEMLGKIAPDTEKLKKPIQLGLTMEKGFAYLEPNENPTFIDQLFKNYQTVYLKEGKEKTAPYPGALAVVSAYATAGINMAIVSNKDIHSLRAAVHRFQFDHYIPVVAGDSPETEKKPSAMLFDKIIRPSFPKIPLENILLVGDTPTDLQFAKNIGVDACWAAYGYGLPEECQKFSPKLIIKNIQELEKLVET